MIASRTYYVGYQTDKRKDLCRVHVIDIDNIGMYFQVVTRATSRAS